MTLTIEERATMLELLDYPNPEGLHSNEARWREFARLEFAVYDQRIQQLEQLNATLAAQIDRQTKVVDAARLWNSINHRDTEGVERSLAILGDKCDEYDAAIAQLARTVGDV
jgi:hypothetical protein